MTRRALFFLAAAEPDKPATRQRTSVERLRGQGELLRGAVEARHHQPEGMGGGAEGVEDVAIAFALRASTIFAAHSARCSGVFAAFRPLLTLARPPRRPSATAAGFSKSSGGLGVSRHPSELPWASVLLVNLHAIIIDKPKAAPAEAFQRSLRLPLGDRVANACPNLCYFSVVNQRSHLISSCGLHAARWRLGWG